MSTDMEYSSKSAVVVKFGGYDAIEIRKFPLPDLEGRIEVEVKYCGLNFADLYTRKGLIPKTLPFVLGMECCGSVKAIGFDTTEYQIGDKVICYNYEGGMNSDVIRVSPHHCFVIPNNVSYEIGASIFVNYVTAYISLFNVGNLQEDQNVFIPSCAGGFGCAATQLAKLIPNVTVYGTASKGKEEFAKENGVDHIIDISPGNLTEEQLNTFCPERFDLVLETEGGTASKLLQQHLHALGRCVYLGANSIIHDEHRFSLFTLIKLWWSSKSINPYDLIMKNHSVAGLHIGLLVEQRSAVIRNVLNNVIDYFNTGKIHPRIDSVWSFDQIVTATKVLAERRNVGKVLLKF